MNFRALAAAIAFALPLAGPANAVSFNRADRNGDGVITQEEAYRSMKRMSEVHFYKCDRNGDGVVDPGEFGCLSGIYDALYRSPND